MTSGDCYLLKPGTTLKWGTIPGVGLSFSFQRGNLPGRIEAAGQGGADFLHLL